MSITVTCSNGHRIKAPDKRAGTKGRCPACGVEVMIPSCKHLPSDSSILRILGIGQELRRKMKEEDEAEEQRSQQDEITTRMTIYEGGLPVKNPNKTKLCPKCGWEIDSAYKICPQCRFYFLE